MIQDEELKTVIEKAQNEICEKFYKKHCEFIQCAKHINLRGASDVKEELREIIEEMHGKATVEELKEFYKKNGYELGEDWFFNSVDKYYKSLDK